MDTRVRFFPQRPTAENRRSHRRVSLKRVGRPPTVLDKLEVDITLTVYFRVRVRGTGQNAGDLVWPATLPR
jgi:hypothetical protein